MTIRKTFQWTIVLVAMLAAGGWYALQFAFDHKDRLVLDAIRKDVAQKVPDWGLEIGDAKFDFQGRVWLTDVTITPDRSQPAVVTIPRCLVTLDADLLFEQKQVVVLSVRLLNPQVLLARDGEGNWNWQGLSKPAASDQTPEVAIEHGDVLLRIAAADGLPQTEVGSRDVNLRLVPAGRRRYAIQGASQIEGAGALTFGGDIDFNTLAWRLVGRADQVDMSQGLLEKAAVFAPDMGRKVAEFSGGSLDSRDGTVIPGAPARAPSPSDGLPVQTVSFPSPAAGQLRLPDLGLSASLGIEFDLSSDGQQKIPNYQILARVMDGTVTEPLSPVPLANLRGELLVQNDRLMIRGFSASNGASQLAVSGEIQQTEGRTLRDFEIAASNLLIDDELRHLLPGSAQKLFDRIRPAGLFTIRGRFRGDGVSTPQVRLDEFTAINCSIQHELFPYPITGITGTVRQEEETLFLDLKGSGAGRPIAITGSVTNPGPEAAATIDIGVDEFPLNRQFVDCLVSPKHQEARKALESLNLTGTMNVRVRFVRPAGVQQPTQMGLDVDLAHGTLNFNKFPYAVTELSGHVHFNPWQEKVWHFTRLEGQHGPVGLVGEGRFAIGQPGGGHLDLTLSAKGVPLDQDLHHATTTALPSLHEAWVQLNPDRRTIVHLDNVHITWTPGQTPNIELPSIQVRDGSLILAAFPFRWNNVDGDLAWKDGRVTIHQLTARHEETQLRIEGRGTAASYFDVLPKVPPNEPSPRWQLRCEDVKVRILDPGGEFRSALPGDAASVVNQLDPRGPLDADIAFEMKGYSDPQGGPDRVTSHWQLVTKLTSDRLAVGVELTDVTGTVTTDIRVGVNSIDIGGWLEFERARAFDMTLSNISGPFVVENYRVSVGSPNMLQSPKPGGTEPQVSLDEQLTAQLYDGTVELNAIASFDPTDSEKTTYQARVEVKNADLSLWAKEWGYANMNVAGTTRAHLNLSGQGTSELGLKGEDCWLQISSARLGELPVVAQMLTQVVAPQQRNKTAFTYGHLAFSIHDGMFDFGPIRERLPRDKRGILLDGKVLRMVGQGYLPFAPQLDPRMNLDFYSKSDQRNPLMAIPIVGPLAKSMSDNWIHVRVTGPPSDPRIRTQTEVPVDNAFREFFGALETGLMPVAPLR